MRIISGKYRGIRLHQSKNLNLRPTKDSSKEALFNILQNFSKIEGFSLAGARMLDLFCGTGNIGLEALSRGADFVTFIDQNHSHLELVKKNATLFKDLEQKCEFKLANATNLPQNIAQKYDLAFLDPPYYEDLVVSSLNSLLEGGWLNENALIVMEYGAKEDFSLKNQQFLTLDQRKYGNSLFTFLKYDK